MKSCKKISALIIALILTFSVISCVMGVSAENVKEEETFTTTPENASPDDLTYVPPTYPTETSFDPSAFASEYSSQIADINENIGEKTSFIEALLEKINDFFNAILDFINNLGGFSFGDIFGTTSNS